MLMSPPASPPTWVRSETCEASGLIGVFGIVVCRASDRPALFGLLGSFGHLSPSGSGVAGLAGDMLCCGVVR